MRLPERPGRRRDREPDITGNRAYPGIFRAYSGPIPGIFGHERIVACPIVCRRIACRPARRVREHPSPDTASRRVVACPIVRRRIACRTVRRRRASHHVSARIGDLTSLPCPRSGERNTRRRPCLGPTWRCSRRRHRRFTNIYSFIWPPRFIVARSAARLSAIVGPLSPRHAAAGETRQKERPGARHHEE